MSTWEERMAARTAARLARQAADRQAAEEADRQRRADAGLPEPVDYPGHEGYHWHVRYMANYQECSCGGHVPDGCWTIGLDDPRYWSGDPAERAQAIREDDDFRAWVTCRYCGMTGVTAGDVLGVWPPRRIGERASP